MSMDGSPIIDKTKIKIYISMGDGAMEALKQLRQAGFLCTSFGYSKTT